VTSANGTPIESVAVWLTYTVEQYDTTQLDTVNIVVTNRAQIYSVDVYDIHGSYVRNLYSGYPDLGAFPRFFWDGRDDSLRMMKSGKYYIRYTRNATILKTVPYLMDGLITAWTDGDGNFTIGEDNLPIGELFDWYNYDGSFNTVVQVTRDLTIYLSRATLHKVYTVTLQTNNIYHGDFILK
jgi:hypothetical protein